jgi:uncharacterized protein
MPLNYKFLILLSFIFFIPACSSTSGTANTVYPINSTLPVASSTLSPSVTIQSSNTALSTISSATLTIKETQQIFDIGKEITIEYLISLQIDPSQITFEEQLTSTAYYSQHIVSYLSEGNKIYALMTIPKKEPPLDGYKAIVFNHGYIPPNSYKTTERYTAYVDYLASNGFVVLKIDYRGHGSSEGTASGTYFSSAYTIDAISALKSLQQLDIIDHQGIGMWGHSMAGNLVLRAMLIEPDIKAGVIWAGAVYSYADLVRYGIDDNTYRPPATSQPKGTSTPVSRSNQIFETYGIPDLENKYWQAVALTENIEYLSYPIQLHHASNDTVVNLGYSSDLSVILNQNDKVYEFYIYPGGGHNIVSPYFEQAMQRTVEFFNSHL